MHIPADRLNTALYDPKLQVMNFLNEIAQQYPQAISFAPGRPLERNFDVAASLSFLDDFVRHTSSGANSDLSFGYAALGQYGKTNGVIGDLIAQLLRNDEGLAVSANDIVVTVGCQEAMCLCLLALCGNPGDVALVADPAYIGISGAARLFGIETAGVPMFENGLDLQVLEDTVISLQALGKQARLLYLSPDFSNPTGITITREQRNALTAMALRHNLLILEDHAYNYFQFDGNRIPPLMSGPRSDHVIYLGSFSKSVYPGLRLGYIATTATVVDAAGMRTSLAEEFSKVKSLLSVNTSPLCQAIVGGLLVRHNCTLREFVEPRRAFLKRNRDAMLVALEAHFPRSEAWCREVIWNRPVGGFFLKLNMPFLLTDEDLSLSARKYNVLWSPMSYFYEDSRSSREIRLSFSYVTPEQIDFGIAALARMVRDRIAQSEGPH